VYFLICRFLRWIPLFIILVFSLQTSLVRVTRLYNGFYRPIAWDGIAIVWRLSVRPSVRLSVTLMIPYHTMYLGLRGVLLFVPLGGGILLERGRQTRVTPVKSRHLTAIGSSSVKTVAHWHRHAAYHNKHC